MNKIIYSLVYNRKKMSETKRGMALVQVEAYLDRKKKYFSTKSLSETGTMGCKKTSCKKPP